MTGIKYLTLDLFEAGAGQSNWLDIGEAVRVPGLPGAADDIATAEITDVIGEGDAGLDDVTPVGDVLLPFDLFTLASQQVVKLQRRHRSYARPVIRSLPTIGRSTSGTITVPSFC